MSGLGLVLNIAKSGLNAQQYGIDVTAHNIANAYTPGYTRQSAVHEAKDPASYGGVLLGRGVDTTQVIRASDQFIENRLMQQKSSMSCFEEMENYMRILEGFFNESSENSISTILADFWNSWNDVANNPSGTSERIALYEHSNTLTEQFNALNIDLIQIKTDLTNAIDAGIDDINQITEEIAQLNNQIVGMEVSAVANDLRDRRNTLISELSENLDVKTFEQDNGSITVVTARGCILVHKGSSYSLELGGTNGDRVKWRSSGGTTTDITDYINEGKLGGWLEMRDEVIEKYKLDLDAVAKEFIWAVNKQHSQGVGLEAFSTTTGTYSAASTSAALDSSGLSFADRVVDGSFGLWIYDSNGDYDTDTTLAINAAVTSVDDIVTAINSIDPTKIAATTIDGKLQINGLNGYTFAFSDDTSNVLAALGVNTFFTGAGADGMGVNNKIGSDVNFIAAAQIGSSGERASGDNSNALAAADLKYASVDISRWTCDRINGNTEGTVTNTIENYYHGIVSSIGITSASVSSAKDFNEVMVNQLSELRDGISAVSLDEEMMNIIKYQRAYGAAAKLISVSDEMLNTLLGVK
jgi:flagellar hook-associated protein 1 FlgK